MRNRLLGHAAVSIITRVFVLGLLGVMLLCCWELWSWVGLLIAAGVEFVVVAAAQVAVAESYVQVQHSNSGASIFVEEAEFENAIKGLEQTLAKMRSVHQALATPTSMRGSEEVAAE